MINNLFHFDERGVERVMIPRIDCDILRLDQSAEKNLALIRETRHSRFPVIDGGMDNLVGMVLVKDLLDAMFAGDQEPWKNLESFCRETMVVPETLRVSNLFDMMREKKAHLACVVDEYGSFVGLITMEDLLEEIVGEISDETDKPGGDFPTVATETGWHAHGFATLADVERVTGFAVVNMLNANTLSGLFRNRLERIPTIGEIVVEGEYRFTVEMIKDRHVASVIIEKLSPPPEQAKGKSPWRTCSPGAL